MTRKHQNAAPRRYELRRGSFHFSAARTAGVGHGSEPPNSPSSLLPSDDEPASSLPTGCSLRPTWRFVSLLLSRSCLAAGAGCVGRASTGCSSMVVVDEQEGMAVDWAASPRRQRCVGDRPIMRRRAFGRMLFVAIAFGDVRLSQLGLKAGRGFNVLSSSR